MSWFILIPVIQGVVGAFATAAAGAGLISSDTQKWLLLVAGLPLTVQVPLAAHMMLQTDKKAQAAINVISNLPGPVPHEIRPFLSTGEELPSPKKKADK